MKKDCVVARWLFFLKKNKSFRFLFFFSCFAHSEHFLKSLSGTFSPPMAHMLVLSCDSTCTTLLYACVVVRLYVHEALMIMIIYICMLIAACILLFFSQHCLVVIVPEMN